MEERAQWPTVTERGANGPPASDPRRRNLGWHSRELFLNITNDGIRLMVTRPERPQAPGRVTLCGSPEECDENSTDAPERCGPSAAPSGFVQPCAAANPA